jgi:hypothetical protein
MKKGLIDSDWNVVWAWWNIGDGGSNVEVVVTPANGRRIKGQPFNIERRDEKQPPN